MLHPSLRYRIPRLGAWLAFAALCAGISAGYAQAGAGVGRTPTSLGVSATGEAQYTLPLRVPSGVNTLTPQLALVYGHRGGDGNLGAGWALAGQSTIYRCPQSLGQDGAVREVRLDAADKYCLDGNRLRLTGGTYGQAGSTYQSEFETFARVTAYGSSGSPASGPAYFIVERKDGLVYEYGNSLNSRIEARGMTHVRAWALTKIRDRAGNAITYNYTEDMANGSYRLDTIVYAAHTIYFEYETKPVGEVDLWYRAGAMIKIVTRLKTINVGNPNMPARTYRLAYEPYLSAAGNSRLESVTECGRPDDSNTAEVCLTPTTFTYQSTWWGTGEGPVTSGIPTALDALPIDVNGDGRTDLVYSSSTVSGSGTWRIAFGRTDWTFDPPVDTGLTNTNYTQAFPIDYNADGRIDVMVPGTSTWWVMLGTATGLAAPVNTGAPVQSVAGNATALDINGDGLDDLVWAQTNAGGNDAIYARLREVGGAFAASVTTIVAPLGAGTSIVTPVWGRDSFRSRIRQPDFNGDGRKDVIYHFMTSNGAKYAEAVLGGGAGVMSILGPYYDTGNFAIPLDINGDGLSDLVMKAGTGFIYRLSDGKSFTPWSTQIQIYPWDTNRTLVVQDQNGDGCDDVVVRTDYYGLRWLTIRSTCDALVDDRASNWGSTTSAEFAFAADTTGDGRADGIAVRSGSEIAVIQTSSTAADAMWRTTDSYGNLSQFTYTATGQSAYTRGTATAYPLADYAVPISVVESLALPIGGGLTYTQTYSYSGARSELQGRGFAGFETQSVVDSRTGVQSRTTRLQGFPLTGQIARQAVYQPNGTTLISDQQMTYSSLTNGASPEVRTFVWANTSTAKRYEVGGTYNGAQIDEVVTTTSVDAYGTPYDVTVTRTEKTSGNGVQPGALYSSRTLHSSLLNDTTSWCLGRPQMTQEIGSHTQYGGAAVTRRTSRTWNGPMCRVTQEITEPGDPTYQVTRDLGYDSFGNVNSETITGLGMQPRATTTAWDASGRFPLSTTNALGQTTSRTFSSRRGVLLGETDPNGRTSSYNCDAFNVLLSKVEFDGTSVSGDWYYDCRWSWTQGTAPCPAGAIRYQRVGDTVGHDVTTSYDSLDRPIRIQEYKLDYAVAVTRKEYTSRGLLARESAPCAGQSCTPQYWTSYTYDLLGRVTQVSRPESDAVGAPTQTSYTYYEGLSTREVDALGKTSTKIVNAAGTLARTTDHDGYAVSFDYEAFGHIARVQDSAGVTLQSASYSARGLKLTAEDADRGNWSFTYNALGELISQTDAKGQTSTFAYDKLSRMTSRVEPEGSGSITSTWSWGTSAGARNIGQLEWMEISGTGVSTYRETYTYDAKSRLTQTEYAAGGTSNFVNVTYDSYCNAPASVQYPTSTGGYRLMVAYTYGGSCLLKSLSADGMTWTLNSTDLRGNPTMETRGTNITTSRAFDAVTGRLKTIQSGVGGGAALQNLGYLYDRVGNVIQRQDNNQGLTESFYYDNLHRLDYSTLKVGAGTPVTNLDLSYAPNGNLLSKSDVGTYTYDPIKVHAVRTISGGASQSLYYDPNGNLFYRSGGRMISWYASNYPKLITQDALNSSYFEYTPDRRRWDHEYKSGGTTYSQLYIGKRSANHSLPG